MRRTRQGLLRDDQPFHTSPALIAKLSRRVYTPARGLGPSAIAPEDTAMPTVEKRTGSGGVTSRATVRVLHRTHTKTFKRLTDAKRWAQSTEAAIREARHFPKAEAQKHTVRDMIDRYRTEVLPKKGPSMVRNQDHRHHDRGAGRCLRHAHRGA